jgi:hypothetical protein
MTFRRSCGLGRDETTGSLRRALTFWLSTALLAVLPTATHAQAVAPASPVSTPSPNDAASVAQAPENADQTNLSPEELAKLQAEIIKQSQNPVGNIAIIPFQNNFNYGYGPYQRLQYNINLQPVVPLMLSKDWNLIARTIIPIIDNPSSAPPQVCASQYGCGTTFGIGDLNPQFYFAPAHPGNLIWGAGPQFLFPTGAPASLSAGKYGVGPAIVGLIMPGNIVTGVLVTQMWSYAGDSSKPGVSTFFIQPFFNYNLKHAWAIFLGSSGITANWNATPQQGKWLVPLGAGLTKTFKLGDQPMQLGLLYFGNVVRPTNAAYGTIRFNWSLLYPIKRGLKLP